MQKTKLQLQSVDMLLSAAIETNLRKQDKKGSKKYKFVSRKEKARLRAERLEKERKIAAEKLYQKLKYARASRILKSNTTNPMLGPLSSVLKQKEMQNNSTTLDGREVPQLLGTTLRTYSSSSGRPLVDNMPEEQKRESERWHAAAAGTLQSTSFLSLPDGFSSVDHRLCTSESSLSLIPRSAAWNYAANLSKTRPSTEMQKFRESKVSPSFYGNIGLARPRTTGQLQIPSQRQVIERTASQPVLGTKKKVMIAHSGRMPHASTSRQGDVLEDTAASAASFRDFYSTFKSFTEENLGDDPWQPNVKFFDSVRAGKKMVKERAIFKSGVFTGIKLKS